jgi:hypothetical protein
MPHLPRLPSPGQQHQVDRDVPEERGERGGEQPEQPADRRHVPRPLAENPKRYRDAGHSERDKDADAPPQARVRPDDFGMGLAEPLQLGRVVVALLLRPLVLGDQIVIAAGCGRPVIRVAGDLAYRLQGGRPADRLHDASDKRRRRRSGTLLLTDELGHDLVVNIPPRPGPANLGQPACVANSSHPKAGSTTVAAKMARALVRSAATSAAKGRRSSSLCGQLCSRVRSSGAVMPASTAFRTASSRKKSRVSRERTLSRAALARTRATLSRSSASASTRRLVRWSLSRPTNRATRRPPTIATSVALVPTIVHRNGDGSVATRTP